MVAHAILLSPDDEDLTFVSVKALEKDPQLKSCVDAINSQYDGKNLISVPFERVLCGNTVSQCHFLRDLCGNLGAYFIFEDLSVNITGKFKIKICASNIMNNIDRKLYSIISDPFQILSSKETNYLKGIKNQYSK